MMMTKVNKAPVLLFLTLIPLITAQSAAYVNAQPITAAATFEQLAQGQQQQPSAAATNAKPGTILLTTFPNGTSKAQFVNGTTVQVLNGVGYLVLDSSASVAAAAAASAPVSNTVVNRIYQAIAVAISINIEQNDTLEPPVIPLPPQPNETEPGGPDQDCLFDPSLPKCTPGPEGCPEGFGMNEDGQCFPLGGCPDGYHSNEDDETGACYPDSEPCPEGQVRSDEGNYCVVPRPAPSECEEGQAVNPSTGECEAFSCPAIFPPPPGCPGFEDLEPQQQCEVDPTLPECTENGQEIDNAEEAAPEPEPEPEPELPIGDGEEEDGDQDQESEDGDEGGDGDDGGEDGGE